MTTKPLLTKASIGKRYVRRDGFISGPITERGADYKSFPFDDALCRNSYTKDGRWSLGSSIFPVDLIRLATPAEIRAGKALPVKERNVKEGRTYTHWAWEQRHANGYDLGICYTREEAREVRAAQILNKIKCGPIFRLTITCPAWSPK